ncbi:hypothetical protein BJ742DRAFT_765031 [Cladochytrium replicatum]|nr:hypothetical protein BJ742DRAFT_765031 [Cladochytrium replicatum]
MASVKVVVRVRPFNSREIARNAQCIIRMDGQSTAISRPAFLASGDGRTTPSLLPATPGPLHGDENKSFAYDCCFWSFSEHLDDGPSIRSASPTTHPNWATQDSVYNELGKELLDHAFEGYNVCIFAYGQTGSGKSYTMMGYGPEKGIIPRACVELFERIKAGSGGNVEYQVEVQYMEIYNERVRDLLNPNNSGNLRVREHPVLGPYVEELSKLVVSSYDDIARLMDEGNKARTVAATNMNETSSRSHAVFTLNLSQRRLDPETGLTTQKTARISLVDLAGSERADATGATGQRLKEGANINKSLTTLGKVISALADASSSPLGNRRASFLNDGAPRQENKRLSVMKRASAQQIHIPYRDSVLTWILKDCLGGNSRTVMIAAISPADINYDETLSTLRYAERAKKIMNKAVINEDAGDRIVRELQEEVAELRRKLQSYESSGVTLAVPEGSGGHSETKTGHGDLDIEQLRDQLEASEKLVKVLSESHEDKLLRTKTIEAERLKVFEELGIVVGANGISTPQKIPYLVNLNEDPLMSECLLYKLSRGTTNVGSDENNEILLRSESIQNRHCFFEHDESGAVTLHPIEGARTYVNGQLIPTPKQLKTKYRLIFGDNHVFRFMNPVDVRREHSERQAKSMDGLNSQSSSNGSSSATSPITPWSALRDDARSERSIASDVATTVIDWNFAQRERHGSLSSPLASFHELLRTASNSSFNANKSLLRRHRSTETLATELDNEFSSYVPGELPETMKEVIESLEAGIKVIGDREMQRLLQENLVVSQEINEMEIKLNGERERLQQIEREFNETVHRAASKLDEMSSASGTGSAPGLRSEESDDLAKERARVRALEEELKSEKERMMRSFEAQRMSYDSKRGSVPKKRQSTVVGSPFAGTSSANAPVVDPAPTPRQLELAAAVVQKWRSRRYIQLAERVLAAGILVKEANIIARELGRKVLYQIVIMDKYHYIHPTSFWEAGSPDDRLPYGLLETDGINVNDTPFVGIKVLDGKHDSVCFWSLEALEQRLKYMRALYEYADKPSTVLLQRRQQYAHVNGGVEIFFDPQRPWYTFIGTGAVRINSLVWGVTKEIHTPVIEWETGKTKGYLRILISAISSQQLDDHRMSDGDSQDSELTDVSEVENGQRSGDESFDRAETDESDSSRRGGLTPLDLIDGTDLLFEISILELVNISENEFTQLHCQFRLSEFGVVGNNDADDGFIDFSNSSARGIGEKMYATEPANDFGNGAAIFNFSQSIRVVVTERVREVVSSGFVRFEVFGRRKGHVSQLIEDELRKAESALILNNERSEMMISESDYYDEHNQADVMWVSGRPAVLPARPQPALRIKSQAPPKINADQIPQTRQQRHEVLAQVQLLEMAHQTGEFIYVPVHLASSSGESSTFLARQGLQRRLQLRLTHVSGRELAWKRITSLKVGHIKRVPRKQSPGNASSANEETKEGGIRRSRSFKKADTAPRDRSRATSTDRKHDDDVDYESSPERESMINLKVPEDQRVFVAGDGRRILEVGCAWDSSLHEFEHLNKVTRGPFKVEMYMEWTVQVERSATTAVTAPRRIGTPWSNSEENPEPSTRTNMITEELTFGMYVALQIFERDFKVKAMVSSRLLPLLDGSGLNAKYGQCATSLYEVSSFGELVRPRNVRPDWVAKDTRKTYVRGEECLRGWTPGGQEIILDYWKGKARREWREEVEGVRQLDVVEEAVAELEEQSPLRISIEGDGGSDDYFGNQVNAHYENVLTINHDGLLHLEHSTTLGSFQDKSAGRELDAGLGLGIVDTTHDALQPGHVISSGRSSLVPPSDVLLDRLKLGRKFVEVWRRRSANDIGLDQMLSESILPAWFKARRGSTGGLKDIQWTTSVRKVSSLAPVTKRGWLLFAGSEEDDDLLAFAGDNLNPTSSSNTQNPNSSPSKDGSSQRESEEDGIWLKRWFVIRRPYLFVYSNQTETDELYVINLTDVALQYSKDLWSILQRRFVFAMYTRSHSVLLQAQNEALMKEWIEAIDPLHVASMLSSKGKVDVEGVDT